MKVRDRLKAWKEGRILDLLRECRVIQERLKTGARAPAKDCAKSFAKLMFAGKVNAALKLLTEESENGVHKMSEEIRNELLNKHPKPAPILDGSLLHGPVDKLLPSHFDNIDDFMIYKVICLTKVLLAPCISTQSSLDTYLLAQNTKRKEKIYVSK